MKARTNAFTRARTRARTWSCLARRYGELLEKLAKGVKICLRCKVRSVDTRTPGNVRVTTSSGIFSADAVVVTVPLGVLQRSPCNGGIRFQPPLPERKLAAMSRLGFGALNKVALFFSAPFWQHRTDFFGRTTFDPRDRGLFFLFFNLYHSTGAPLHPLPTPITHKQKSCCRRPPLAPHFSPDLAPLDGRQAHPARTRRWRGGAYPRDT